MWNSRNPRSSGRALALAALLALASTVTAAAADDQPIRLTPAGQAAAKAALLTKADLVQGLTWTGGPTKPDGPSDLKCANFDPKQSDLIVNGKAESKFKSSDGRFQFESDSTVLQTPTMVRLDWKRTVQAPLLVGCLRSVFQKSAAAFEKSGGKPGKLVSLRRIAFPSVATYTAALRMVIDYPTSTGPVRVRSDIIFIGGGTAELTLTASVAIEHSTGVMAEEIRLARILAGRISPVT